jgi:cytochrome c biogenesis protein CcdA
MAKMSPNEPSPSFRELLVDLGVDVSALLHDEIDLVKTEALRALRASLLVFAVAGVLGTAAVLTLCAAAVLALSHVLDPAWAALMVAMGVAAIAFGFALFIRDSRRFSERRPAAIRKRKEDTQWPIELKFR